MMCTLMAFSINRELEALRAENDRLKAKIAIYEIRLSVQEKTIVEMRGKIEKLESQVDEYRRIIGVHMISVVSPVGWKPSTKRIVFGVTASMLSPVTPMGSYSLPSMNRRWA